MCHMYDNFFRCQYIYEFFFSSLIFATIEFVYELSDLEVLSFEDESLLAFLQDTKLIKTSLACPKCLSDCAIYKKKWLCVFFACKTRVGKNVCTFRRGVNCKRSLPTSGRRKHHMQYYLAEFLFNHFCKHNNLRPFTAFLQAAATLH